MLITILRQGPYRGRRKDGTRRTPDHFYTLSAIEAASIITAMMLIMGGINCHVVEVNYSALYDNRSVSPAG